MLAPPLRALAKLKSKAAPSKPGASSAKVRGRLQTVAAVHTLTIAHVNAQMLG